MGAGPDYEGRGGPCSPGLPPRSHRQVSPGGEAVDGNAVHSLASSCPACRKHSGTRIRRRPLCHLEQSEHLSLACSPAASATPLSAWFLRLPFPLSERRTSGRSVGVCTAHLWQNGLDNSSWEGRSRNVSSVGERRTQHCRGYVCPK